MVERKSAARAMTRPISRAVSDGFPHNSGAALAVPLESEPRRRTVGRELSSNVPLSVEAPSQARLSAQLRRFHELVTVPGAHVRCGLHTEVNRCYCRQLGRVSSVSTSLLFRIAHSVRIRHTTSDVRKQVQFSPRLQKPSLFTSFTPPPPAYLSAPTRLLAEQRPRQRPRPRQPSPPRCGRAFLPAARPCALRAPARR
jgi:hypothetical protein